LLDGCALREGEGNRGTRCGKTARRGLGGGRRVTGVPIAEAPEAALRPLHIEFSR
jgi:hypothetical protein